MLRVAVIINPVAGPHARRVAEPERRARLADDALRAQGVEPAIHFTRARGHAAELAAAAVRDGADGVVAWGGDGTVSEVASALLDGPVSLSVVPTGSGNGFARALGVPRDAAAALARIGGAPVRAVDVGMVNGRAFVSVAGCGFDAHVARLFNAMRPRSYGFASYVAITARELWKYRGGPVTALVHGERIAVDDALIVAFANSPQYGNGARIAPAARVDDGLLDLVMVRRRSPARTLLAARRLFDGTVAAEPSVTMRPFSALTIMAEAPIAFHVDGEPCQGGHELEVAIKPGALRVRV
jgi:YegS/Rv2252/BmrU family lipid kinase